MGSTSAIILSDQVLKYQTGSWSLDPLAPKVPQDLVQLVGGRGGMKRRCCFRRSNKKIPPTAMLHSRKGSIDATVHVVGESALRTAATIQLKTRKGSISLDVVSLRFGFHITCHRSNPVPGLYRSHEDSAY